MDWHFELTKLWLARPYRLGQKLQILGECGKWVEAVCLACAIPIP